MEALDKIPGVIGYAVIKAQDGSIEEIKGSSSAPIGDLAAYFSSAGEVITNNLALGSINYLSLCYGANRLVIFPYEARYLALEVERGQAPSSFIESVKSSIAVHAKPKFELPRSISSKVQQINLLVEEFGGQDNTAHWTEMLNHGLGVLGGDILPFIGIIDGKLGFKEQPPEDKEDSFVQGLRTVIDFLVKKGVLEVGSSQARAKVQAVIDRMK